jgi:hypothetical protein
LIAEARDLTGISDPEQLAAEGLRALVAREAARRLALLGGSMPGLKKARRRRSPRQKPR